MKQCDEMAKSLDKTGLPNTDPASRTGAESESALLDARMFQDGPQAMLIDQADLDDALLSGTSGPSEVADHLVSLTLDDLLPDDAGEVVLVAADNLPINLLSSELVTEAGIAPAHVTAGGMEVAGLHYYNFESGLTVYSPVDLLILDDPNSG